MACRYLHEAIDVIADHCPDLVETLHRLQEAGVTIRVLGRTPGTGALHTKEPGRWIGLWYAGKHHRHGASIEVLTGHTGFPARVSPAKPGSTHDITAARAHVLPALCKAARSADLGGQGLHRGWNRDQGAGQGRARAQWGHPVAQLPHHQPESPRRAGQRPAQELQGTGVRRPLTHQDHRHSPSRPRSTRA